MLDDKLVYSLNIFFCASFILVRFHKWQTEITKEESINSAKNGGNKGKSVSGKTPDPL